MNEWHINLINFCWNILKFAYGDPAYVLRCTFRLGREDYVIVGSIKNGFHRKN